MKTTIEQLPRVNVRDFVKAGAFARSGGRGVVLIPGHDSIHYRTNMDDMTIEFRATGPDGNQVVTPMGLICQPTHLGVGNMWLFRSFRTGQPCRVLFLVDGMMVARGDIIGPRYKQQLQGRADRMFSRYNRKPPTRANGKTTYRGQLTPYGKRVQRYYDTIQDLDVDVAVYLTRRFKLWKYSPGLETLRDANY